MFTVSGGYLAAIADWLKASGYGAAPLCQRIGRLKAQDTVPLADAERLLMEAAVLSGDALAAWRIGQRIDWHHLGALGHMLSSARTLEDLLNSYVYYESLFYGASIANLHRDAEGLTVYWNTRGKFPAYSGLSISSVVAVIRLCGIPAAAIAEVTVPDGDESRQQLYEQMLGCAPVHAGPRLGITLRREFLGREVAVRDERRDRQARAQLLFSELGDAVLAADLYDEIAARLPQRDAKLESVASALAVSPRTLQRRLTGIPDGLRGAVNRVRMQLAQEYLRDDGMTLVSISLLLGYSEQSAFQLAFRKVFGQAPGQWRRERRVAGGDRTIPVGA
jgi:AraC-like DNA-binding protein